MRRYEKNKIFSVGKYVFKIHGFNNEELPAIEPAVANMCLIDHKFTH